MYKYRSQISISTSDVPLKVRCVIFGYFKEDTATSSGYVLDCGVFHAPSPEFASELQWLVHPNLSLLFVVLFEDMSSNPMDCPHQASSASTGSKNLSVSLHKTKLLLSYCDFTILFIYSLAVY